MPRKPGVDTAPFCPHVTKIRSSILSLACCILLLLVAQHLTSTTAYAQNSSATLSGTVTDSNNALVPGVKIEVISTVHPVRREATTNQDGSFTVTALTPGTYRVKAEATGFAPIETPDVTLNVNDQIRINITLRVGEITQSVQVADVSSVSESAAVGVVMDRRYVENLPLNGRSFHNLLLPIPGYVPATTSSGEAGQFSFNGQRTNTNNFMVDGVGANVSASSSLIAGNLTDGSLPALTAFGGTNNLVSVDALEEFKVQTSTYSPEFGRTPGAQISIVTRSGTNKFHGTLFEYFRNDVLDANDWFFNASGTAKTPLRQNDFGGVIGGPVLFPRFGEGGSPLGYNGRNKTFFFFSYEGLRLRQPFFIITDVPSISARQSASPAVRQLLNAFPLPNGPENPAAKTAQFSAAFSNPATLNATSIRIDHHVGQKLLVFGRYNEAPSESIQRTGGSGSVNTLGFVKNRTRTLTLGATSIFSPTINNELRANYSRINGSSSFELDNFGGAVVPPDSFFFPSFTSREVANLLISLFPGRFSTLFNGTIADNGQRQINVVDNLSVISGSHNLKFGVDYRLLRPIVGPRSYSVTLEGNVDAALTGKFAGQISAETVAREPVFTNFSLYGQDVWRVNKRLTLTYGLRWELNLPPTEQHNNGPRTVMNLDSTLPLALAPAGTPLFRTTHTNFAPRFGFSYYLRQRAGRETTLRGGIGTFYDLGTDQAGNAFSTGFFPYASTKFISNVSFPLTLAQATPAPFSSVPLSTQTPLLAYEPNFKLPYTIQYNVAVEQSLGPHQSFSVSYVAARGRRLLRRETLSVAPLRALVVRNSATSDYDSLQTQFQRRLSRHLQALASYTFSKSLDTASNDSTSFPLTTRIDPLTDRGPSDYDLRHAFSAAISYDIPIPDTGRIGNAILHHWSIDSIVRAQSALPVNVVTGRTLLGISSFARPDLIDGVPVYLTDPSAPGGLKLNRAAFVAPPTAPGTTTPLRQGSLGRNVLRGFPFSQIDLTLRRQFDLNEHVNVQFRTDFFNLLNHPNFGDICRNLTTCGSGFGLSQSMFGRSLGTGGINGGFSPLYQMGGPRSIQFSLKLQF